MSIYFIADTHFSEEGMLHYENRPFENTEEMDATIISNWNRLIKDEDCIYVLGDWGAEGHEAEILNKLKGRKYLVKGNHDVHPNEYYRKAGFAEVYDYPIILQEFWILSHEPLYVNRNMPYANIFGHVHNSPLFKDYSSQHFCVSLERIHYVPIAFEEIVRKVKSGDCVI
ncbi:MAG: metallophosphoesterase [Lachnospiraceae bacterium]|nr:metallophosphoesterase [Lachnospiraceae bacterium]